MQCGDSYSSAASTKSSCRSSTGYVKRLQYLLLMALKKTRKPSNKSTDRVPVDKKWTANDRPSFIRGRPNGSPLHIGQILKSFSCVRATKSLLVVEIGGAGGFNSGTTPEWISHRLRGRVHDRGGERGRKKEDEDEEGESKEGMGVHW